MYLTLTLYSEAVTTIMLKISGFPVSADLYNSFDTLVICFHDLMIKQHYSVSYFPNLILLKTGIL